MTPDAQRSGAGPSKPDAQRSGAGPSKPDAQRSGAGPSKPDAQRSGAGPSGAEAAAPSARVDEAAAAAAARSRTVGVVRDVADKRSTLAALGRALQFPDYYATNLDALEECLRDLSWLPVGPVEVVWEDGPLRDADPRTHRVLGQILAAASSIDGDHPLRVTRVG